MLIKANFQWMMLVHYLQTGALGARNLIGVLKQKFNIFQSVLPIALVNNNDDDVCTIDKLVQVCCALVNLCPSIVSQD